MPHPAERVTPHLVRVWPSTEPLREFPFHAGHFAGLGLMDPTLGGEQGLVDRVLDGGGGAERQSWGREQKFLRPEVPLWGHSSR